MDRSLRAVLVGTFTLRLASGLRGAMLGFYLAQLHRQDPSGPISPEIVGVIGAAFFASELMLSPFFGILSDRLGHHRVMLWGPIFGAVAVLITAGTANIVLLGGTRLLEGASTAASVPSILGYIALATAGSEALRGRAASRFEGATLAGLGLGFIVAPTLFSVLGTTAFIVNAGIYVIALGIYWLGVRDPAGEQEALAREHVNLARYVRLIGHSRVWLLAPTWIAVNASIGLWFGQSIFQLAGGNPRFPDQWLLQGFGAIPITIGAIVVAVVFGAGIVWWGNRFDRYRRTTIILLGIFGGLALVGAGAVVNHAAFGAGGSPILATLIILALGVVGVGLFVLAGATPAAVGLLADVSESFPGDRGAIMGLYSVFLGIGQIAGNLLGGVAAGELGMDGLFGATGILLLLALVPLTRLRGVEHAIGGPETPTTFEVIEKALDKLAPEARR